MTNPVTVGSTAPDFSLKDTSGATVSLKDFAGNNNVVLVFYPKNNTPGWNRQLSSLRDDREKFKKLDTKIIGINPASVEAHDKYCNQFGFGFPILSDPDRKTALAYNALKENGISIQRTVYILDKNGIIKFGEQGMPDDDKLLDVIRSINV